MSEKGDLKRMCGYDVNGILMKAPLDRDALNLLGERALAGDLNAREKLKEELVCLGVHMASQKTRRRGLDFAFFMQQVDLAWFEQKANSYTTYDQYVHDVSWYLRQAVTKTIIRKNELSGTEKVSVAQVEQMRRARENEEKK